MQVYSSLVAKENVEIQEHILHSSKEKITSRYVLRNVLFMHFCWKNIFRCKKLT